MKNFTPRILIFISVGVTVLSFVFTVTLFFPGFLSTDPLMQLQEARSGSYSGFHPPVMGWIWGWIDSWVSGPVGMLALHAGLYWLSVFLLFRNLFPLTLLTPAFIILFGFLPPLFAILSTVWKDVSLGTSLFLSVVILLYAETKKSGWNSVILVTQPLLLYGFAVRHNAAPAVFILELWFALLVSRNFRCRKFKQRLIQTSIFLLGIGSFFLVSSEINRRLVKTESASQGSMILYHDLIGLSARSGKQYLPAFTFPGDEKELNPSDLVSVYTPSSIDMAYRELGGVPGRKLKGADEKWKFQPLVQAWWTAVRDNPVLYLVHRLDLFRANVLNIRHRPIFAFMTGIDQNDLGISTQQSRFQKRIMGGFWRLSQTFLFHGYFYFTLLILLSCVVFRSWKKKRSSARITGATFTLLSGWAYLAPYFFVSVDHDFRYIWWSVICVCVAAVLLFSDSIYESVKSSRKPGLPAYVLDEMDPARVRRYEPIAHGFIVSALVLGLLALIAPFYKCYRLLVTYYSKFRWCDE